MSGHSQTHNDHVSQIFYTGIKQTWTNDLVFTGGFRSPRYRPIPEGMIAGMCSDGIGTKVEIAERLDDYRCLGFDLVAMVCDDASAIGAKPWMMTNTLDVNPHPDMIPRVEELVQGLANAAVEGGVPVVGGEYAQLGHRIEGYGYLSMIWNAALTWVAEPNKIINGSRVKAGDKIVSLYEPGCRSNGFTLIREILTNKCQMEKDAPDGEPWLQHLKTPSAIYTPALQEMLADEDIEVSGMIHVTGGGLSGRLKSYLGAMNLGAHLDSPHTPGYVFQMFLEKGWVDIRTAYDTWCMGNGFLVLTPDA